jgi:hypothetical protein
VCRRIEQSFESRPESVKEVRHLIATTLKAWGADDQDWEVAIKQALLLVASELSTNSVQATAEDFCVAMTVHRDYAEISVEDRAVKAATPVDAGPDESSGRGLAIVAALSCRWGQETHDGVGKKVWSRVALPRDWAPTRGCTL